jgi:antitoxin (DNA-binding transcriptional repressor) of toxin-antitoxin stability system
VRATLVRAIKDGERILIAERSRVSGRLTRLEKQSMPFVVYDVALEFDSIDTPAGPLSFTATMESAGPAPGLILQSRRMDPTFTRKRKARLEILVQEVQRGQGILTWNARRGPVPQGLRMRWRVDRDPGKRK